MTTLDTVSQIWNSIQERFHKTAESLPEQDLPLKIGNASIGYMLRHNAEVEYMFADWFFSRPIPEGFVIQTARGAAGADMEFTNLEELIATLKASNEHILSAMRELPKEKWNEPVKSPMGVSTPLEAVGRLMYHTGIHAGQISLIQKNAAI
ncbi:DinB family protein [Paenibacillus sp. EC2-1]|uniref:DinB family protein n=1 Tax=Paenibacillus sp. EC2-1 TaxID=3388665 RepID=UPI003BEEEBD7